MHLPVDFSYDTCVQFSERIAWSVDDVFPWGTNLDFGRHFLPESLASVEGLPGLSPPERLKLNQIRGNSYAHLFYFTEEFIIATVLRHASAEIFGDSSALRALLRFGDEELKHQQLFKRVGDAFSRGFGSPCELVGSAEEVAGFVLTKSPIAVLLVMLHFELMTQQHYVEHVQGGAELEPHFRSVLKHHWQEEAQHTKIDILELKKIAADTSADQVRAALDEYEELLRSFGAVLEQQAALDVESFEQAIGRKLPDGERAQVLAAQARSHRRTFVGLGLEHPTLALRLEQLAPADGRRRLAMLQEALRE